MAPVIRFLRLVTKQGDLGRCIIFNEVDVITYTIKVLRMQQLPKVRYLITSPGAVIIIAAE